jgi:hypothetical protein
LSALSTGIDKFKKLHSKQLVNDVKLLLNYKNAAPNLEL